MYMFVNARRNFHPGWSHITGRVNLRSAEHASRAAARSPSHYEGENRRRHQIPCLLQKVSIRLRTHWRRSSEQHRLKMVRHAVPRFQTLMVGCVSSCYHGRAETDFSRIHGLGQSCSSG
jgi:hypothetical protein